MDTETLPEEHEDREDSQSCLVEEASSNLPFGYTLQDDGHQVARYIDLQRKKR